MRKSDLPCNWHFINVDPRSNHQASTFQKTFFKISLFPLEFHPTFSSFSSNLISSFRFDFFSTMRKEDSSSNTVSDFTISSTSFRSRGSIERIPASFFSPSTNPQSVIPYPCKPGSSGVQNHLANGRWTYSGKRVRLKGWLYWTGGDCFQQDQKCFNGSFEVCTVHERKCCIHYIYTISEGCTNSSSTLYCELYI